jgi:SNF2 family DNA or RNA helicase
MAELFAFQEEDVNKLKEVPNCLVANEMGTGKTFEAIFLDDERRQASTWGDKRTLVVAPLSVLDSWRKHFEALTDLKVVVVDPKNRTKSFREFTHRRADVFLVHWDALRLMPELKEIVWLHIITDECHRMKNRKAQQTRAVKQIKAAHKTAMSGTPVVNRPGEFWSALNWLYPSLFKSYGAFEKQFVDFEVIYPQGYHRVKGPKNEEELLRLIAPFTVRRLKKDVLPDLPDKYYTELWVDLSPSQRKAYDEMKQEMIAWIGAHEDTPLVAPVVIAQLIRLQQFAAAHMEQTDEGFRMSEPSSKIDMLMDILEDNPGEQVVVFSQFKQLINLTNARLQKAGISYVAYTGDVSKGDRDRNVDAFQAGDARVFTGTIKAGGVGITLTAASTVVFLDRDWSPALNGQAEDRLHRYGQENAVQVIDIIARNTVDLGRMQRLEQKWEWIRRLLGDK